MTGKAKLCGGFSWAKSDLSLERRWRGRALRQAGVRFMTNVLTPEECLDRARMHDQLAATTADASARMMHQAMAAEFRRRAETASRGMRQTASRPIIELMPNVDRKSTRLNSSH